jgi:DNA polymerase-3 subunit gamma/tau
MAHLALARKHRPATFEEVVGQGHVTRTLQNALAADRLTHAYLFSGPRGSGKTTTARLLAKAVNCEAGPTPTPCNACESCRSITAGGSLDVIEMDAASHTGVDDVRNLQERLSYAPSRSRRKVYIVDEVHMLSKAAWNAFLKTLEEPPPHVLFVFATTEPEKVLDTILSRCQRFHFRRLTTQEIEGRLRDIGAKEGLEIEEDALRILAVRGDGSMRDAESLLDQMSAALSGPITVQGIREVLGIGDWHLIHRLLEDVLERRHADALRHLEEAFLEGLDLKELALSLVEGLRNGLFLSVDEALGEHLPLSSEEIESLGALARRTTTPDLLSLLRQATGLLREIKTSPHPRFTMERGLLELSHQESQVLITDLLDRLAEERSGGAPGSPARSPEGGAAARRGPERTGKATRRAAPASAEPARDRPAATPPFRPRPGTASVEPPGMTPAGAAAAAARKPETTGGPSGWSEFLEEVGRRRAMIGAFLREGEARLGGERVVEIRYPPECGFSLEQLSRPENRRLVEDVYAEFTGERMEFRFLATGEPAAQAPERAGVEGQGPARESVPPEARRLLDDRPLLGRLIEEFQGEILEAHGPDTGHEGDPHEEHG